MSWSFLLSYARQYTGLCVDSASIACVVARRAIICQRGPLCARLLGSRHASGTVRLPALLTHVLPYAGRSNYAVVTLLTGKRLPNEPQRAWSAS